MASNPDRDPALRSIRGVADAGSTAVTAEPPWPRTPQGAVQWECFLRDLGPLEACILAGRLNADGVPTIVLGSLAFDDAKRGEIHVPVHLLHRARWVMAWPPVPELELAFLATGLLDPA